MRGSDCAPGDRPDSAPPENASGSTPTVRPLFAAHIDFTYATARFQSFEIGSRNVNVVSQPKQAIIYTGETTVCSGFA